MERTVIKIDEKKCTGCGLCVSGCHEGALQLINGKAVMISDLYCDGLGACIGECPEGAISFEKREAAPYSETAVLERIAPKGEKVVLAHLKHLKDHQQAEFVTEGIDYLKKHGYNYDLSTITFEKPQPVAVHTHQHGGGCPGARSQSFAGISSPENTSTGDTSSQLRQWPVQLHLLSAAAPYFTQSDVLLAADCTAFSVGNFHSQFLKGKSLAIACPKLDSNKENYIEKLTALIDQAQIKSLTVMIMEVPCCGGLLQMAKMAREQAQRKIPIHLIVAGLQGNIVQETTI